MSVTKVNADVLDLTDAYALSGTVAFSGTVTGDNTGKIIQIVNVQTGAVATGTTLMPEDNTIPQKTEGDEYMTLAITPTNSSNKLHIQVVALLAKDASQWMSVALFQDSTAGAIAATAMHKGDAYSNTVVLTHYMTAGTTSETTFKFRAGKGASGTTTFNGVASARQYGGVAASSITITEISAQE